ncbi:MAG: hypothetical protein PF450_01040 [Bacteroidales bacterium]|jgi:late competence protein required for DNA uptake (superfamily II DNA/RNA helicase)|nr:hypothetical protein [Bacteroidales bacterium]
MKTIISKSRRRTPWSGVENATTLQSFIDECTQNNYHKKHPKPTETGEAELLISFDIAECRRCGSSKIQKFGYTPNGIRRYRCKECGRTFTVLTDTIFDSHKIPLTEWLDFLLSIFGHGSFNLVS